MELLQSQRKKIVRDSRAGTGVIRFKVMVDAAQTEGQVTLLTSILAGIKVHRDTLSA